MTTIYPQSVQCALCKSHNDVVSVASTNAFGSMDLDLRPPPMERDILHTYVQRCSHCGYCSNDIASVGGLAVDRVGSVDYMALLSDESFPELAQSFRAHAYLAEAGGELRSSLAAQLHAAWACDDAKDFPGAAESCRQETLRLLDLLQDQGEVFCGDKATDAMLQLDLLRRSGQFAAASALTTTLQAENLPGILAQIASFQDARAKANDRACYTVEAATSH